MVYIGYFSSNIVMWQFKLTGMMSRTECKQDFSPLDQTVDRGVRSKGQIYLNSNYKVGF